MERVEQSANGMKLYFGNLYLGGVWEQDADFPNLYGTFAPRPDWDETAQTDLPLQHIERYHQHSLAIDAEFERDCTEANEAIKPLLVQEGALFMDLIESEHWYLLNDKGEKNWILMPNFVAEGVVWRWSMKE